MKPAGGAGGRTGLRSGDCAPDNPGDTAVSRAAYAFLTGALAAILFPGFLLYSRVTGRFQHRLKERFGILPDHAARMLPGFPRIWFHAASLGEVRAAASIVNALESLLPEASILVSTMTRHGRNLALDSMGGRFPVIYSPLDTAFFVHKALAAARPDVMIFLETEIWPAWIFEARRLGIKTALVNGRISIRSVGRYRKFRPFFRQVLKNFDRLSMISEADAARIRSMGAEPGKICVSGNAKFDLLRRSAEPGLREEMQEALNLEPSSKVLVAGSIRKGETAPVLDAYQEILAAFPEAVLIMAPRHLVRVPEILEHIRRRGLGYHLRTQLDGRNRRRREQVVVLDTFGELFKIYSLASVVFCGGSLVPLGGQNPLEPAVWGKPVCYGPSMENFLDAKQLLEAAGAGKEISGPRMLAQWTTELLGDPELMEKTGLRGRNAVLDNSGAALRHARVIQSLIQTG